MPTVLVTGGGRGIGPMQSIAIGAFPDYGLTLENAFV